MQKRSGGARRAIVVVLTAGAGAAAAAFGAQACGGDDANGAATPGDDASASADGATGRDGGGGGDGSSSGGDGAPAGGDAGAIASCGVWVASSPSGGGGSRLGDVAVDAQSVVVVGWFDKLTDFGKGAVAPQGKNDGFAAKLAADGLGVSWVVTSQLPGTEGWSSAAIAANGDVFVGGSEAAADADSEVTAFVARLAAADGAPLWKRTYTIAESGSVERVRVTGTGDLFVLGTFETRADIEGTTLTNDGLSPDLWYVRLNATNGAPAWPARKIGASGYDGENDVAFEPGGDALVTGPERSSGSLSPGVRYTRVSIADGSVVFDKGFAEGALFSISAGGGGNAYLAGFAQDSIDFGGGAADAGRYARLSAAFTTTASPTLVWSALDPDTAEQLPYIPSAVVGDAFLSCTTSLECKARALADGAPRPFPAFGTFFRSVNRLVSANARLYAGGVTQGAFVFDGQTYASGVVNLATWPFVICGRY